MLIHWNLIKQRPHFLAEHLNKYFNVEVVYNSSFRKGVLVKNTIAAGLRRTVIFLLPLTRYKLIRKINSILLKLQYRIRLRLEDVVWITSPVQYELLKDILPSNIMVVYDCMDDRLEFPEFKADTDLLEKMYRSEKDLLERTNIVIASSKYLRKKLIARYKTTKDIKVVNNAISYPNKDSGGGYVPYKIEKAFKNTKLKKIVYIGCLAEWLDVDLLLESLSLFPDIIYILIGPVGPPLPKNERLISTGPVEHKYIFEIMRRADALVMPFKINELVLSVNPVKLYEYIYSCKPAIVIKYDETQEFRDYVYLYSNKEEYFYYIEKLVSGKLGIKKNCSENRNYAMRNTWEERALIIKELILGNR